MHAEALGYVGFGLSPNGGMTGAGVVIAWVHDDRTAIFHVYMFYMHNCAVNSILRCVIRKWIVLFTNEKHRIM